MPRRGRRGNGRAKKDSRRLDAAVEKVKDYRHEEKRPNNPPAGLATYDKTPPSRKIYSYDPHLDPQLMWAGKAENLSFDVENVALHIHERISTAAIIRAVQREDPQRELFADPQFPLTQQIEFYQHEMNWANRLILGDSLLVMNSLLERELMASKVQMIYVDPPYGVKFSSNFQPRIDRRDVKDSDEDLTREPEMIKAYRDTWTLGIHSYLTYLRDRLLLCRDLLSDSGSVFVQISDENLHHVRETLDEIFGRENFICLVTFAKTTGFAGKTLASIADYILWYAKDHARVKYRQLFRRKAAGDEGATKYRALGEIGSIPEGRFDPNRLVAVDQLTAQGATRSEQAFEFSDKKWLPPAGMHWKTTVEGLKRLAEAGRIVVEGNSLRYVRFLDDFPVFPITNVWGGIGGVQEREEGKLYVVQTATLAVERCALMTTDPGDLVLDPTCGSGTTAYVAERWGRRWITCDTSRVALAIARQRLLTATFPYYKLAHPEKGVAGGLIYKTVPHVTLRSIAQNEPPEQESLYDQPEHDRSKVRVSGPFTVEAIPVPAMTAPDESPIPQLEASTRQNDLAGRGGGRVANPAADHISTMIELLRKAGVNFPGGKKLILENLRSLELGWLHAEAEAKQNGKALRASVSFGPRHGPITAVQTEEATRTANANAYDVLVLAGFAVDPEAQAFIQKNPVRNLIIHFASVNPDVLVGDLLKTSRASQLFTVFGSPDVKLEKQKDGFYIARLLGVDIYDPNTGELRQSRGEDVAAWLLDQDYDGYTFCISQAFFPSDSGAWEKLERALKGSLDPEKFETLRGTVSLPFKAGKQNRIAVKVIDMRGNEVIRVLPL
jgi:adenine-specific DNA-methyltransferase